METKLLNWQDGLNRLMENKELYVRLLDKFMASQQDVPQHMAAALAAGDREKACFDAHALKGVAANLGAEALAHATRQFELAVKNGDDPSGALEELATTLQRTLAAIREFRAA